MREMHEPDDAGDDTFEQMVDVLEGAFWDMMRDAGSFDTDGSLADDERERKAIRPMLEEMLERSETGKATRLGKLLWLGFSLWDTPADGSEYVIEDPEGTTRADAYWVRRTAG